MPDFGGTRCVVVQVHRDGVEARRGRGKFYVMVTLVPTCAQV